MMTDKCEQTEKVAICWFCKGLSRLDWLYEENYGDGSIDFERVYLNYCPKCGRRLPDYSSEQRNKKTEEYDHKKVIRCQNCKHFLRFERPIDHFDGCCELGVGPYSGELHMANFSCESGELKDDA